MTMNPFSTEPKQPTAIIHKPAEAVQPYTMFKTTVLRETQRMVRVSINVKGQELRFYVHKFDLDPEDALNGKVGEVVMCGIPDQVWKEFLPSET